MEFSKVSGRNPYRNFGILDPKQDCRNIKNEMGIWTVVLTKSNKLYVLFISREDLSVWLAEYPLKSDPVQQAKSVIETLSGDPNLMKKVMTKVTTAGEDLKFKLFN